jgi:hypothetical protein
MGNVDPHCLDADQYQDPYSHFNAERILLLVKVMQICDHCSTDPAWTHSEPLKLLNTEFNRDTDPAFHSNTDPDQASPK